MLFEIKNFSDKKRFNNINIKLYPGEIVGLFGLTGAGRSELAQGVCGFRKVTSGEIYYKGVKLKIESSYDAIKKGLVYLTEDRKIYGLFLEMSIKKNISALNLKFITKMGLIDQRKEKAQGLDYVEKLGIRSPSIDKAMSKLSGGNQQKVLISKLLTVKPKVIFLDEPTRGIDVGAKMEIHKLIRNMASEGMGVIMIPSELPEIVGICDRVIVMHEGSQCGELKGRDINESNIIHLASGLKL